MYIFNEGSMIIDAVNIPWKRAGITSTGWDPEIFVVDGKGKMVPAFKFLPSKHDPFQIDRGNLYEEDGDSERAYWDGFQAEFTTRPYTCHGWAFDEIQRGLQTVLQQARKVETKAKLTLQNVFEVSTEDMFSADPEQIALGCDPSFNAYNTNPFRLDNPFDLPYRMAGGHIHFGLRKKFVSDIDAGPSVKYLDLLLALPTVGIFAEIDNPIRRNYYGRAGEFRLPAHGIEYRTLSNAWMGHPAVSNVLMDMARVSFGPSVEKALSFKDLGVKEEQVRDIINNTDVISARKFYADHKELWTSMLNELYYDSTCTKNFHKMVEEGVESVIPSFRDLEKNWHLQGGWKTHSNDNNGGTWSNFR
jgi:hypothetical protein